MKRFRPIFFGFLILALPACHSPQGKATAWVSDQLYFGMGLPNGGRVSEADWEDFLATEVTPRFPAGLTVWEAKGQWKDGSGAVVQEPSKVLQLIHLEDAEADRKTEALIQAYKKRFHQESVLKFRSLGQAGF